MKTIGLTFLLLVLPLVVVSQEAPSAELFDEFGKLYCDDFLARMDRLHHRLSEEPESRSVISIAASQDQVRRALYFEGIVKSYLRDTKGVELTRLAIQRVKGVGEPFTRVWLVPKGAEPPASGESNWDLGLNPGAKGFVWFVTGSKDTHPICPEFDLRESYTELLNANPTAMAHVVIATTSPEAFEKKKVEVAEKLEGIEGDRIRYFFEKYDDYPGFEFWIVPEKR